MAKFLVQKGGTKVSSLGWGEKGGNQNFANSLGREPKPYTLFINRAYILHNHDCYRHYLLR